MKRKFTCITFIILVLILLFTSINSCDKNNKYQDLLSKADSIMNIEDDSAVIAIRILDVIKPELVYFNKKQKMRYHLLYHKAMNKAYIPFKSDSIMLEVTKYYEQYGTANDRMLAYYILGCVYRDIHEAPMALEYYNKATEQADTISKDCDYATLCRIYNQMGILFDIQHLPYQELNALNKATHYALIAKDTLNAIRYYSNRIGAFTCLSQEDSIFYTNKQAARLFLKHGDVLDYKIALGSNFSYYLKHNQLKKAKKAFELYQSSNYKGNPNYEDTFAYQLYEQGMLYLEFGKHDSAYSCLKKSLETSMSYSNKAAATKGLSYYFSKTKRQSLAAQYAIESSMYNDSELLITRNSQLQQIQAMYDYNRNKNMAIESKLVAEQRMNFIYFITSVS